MHFHSIVLEGVYTVREKDGAAVFHAVRAKAAEEVAAIAGRVVAGVRRLFQRRGLPDESSGAAEGSALEAVLVPPPPRAPPGACSGKRGRPPRRIDWAALLKRVAGA